MQTSGEQIGRYHLLEKLGEGGMGVVHLAADPYGRKVAVKVLRPGVAADQTALRRLAREVDSMRRVHSPHVAEILDADVTAEPPYVVTQYVSGRTLEQAVEDDGPLRGEALRRLAIGLASAIAAVHEAGIVHRDLKPGNVMFDEEGRPVVIDFGIAQGVDATRLTATGLVIGTPGYLAPEIIEGDDAGAPADVHAWACTIAFAATGRAPFGGGTFEAIFYKIMEGRPDLDGVPEPLLPLLRAAMARNPAERPTARALAGLTARVDVDHTRLDHTYADPPATKHLTAVAAPPPADPRDFRGQLPPAYPPAVPPYGAPAQSYAAPDSTYPPTAYGPPPYQPPPAPHDEQGRSGRARGRRPDADEPKPYGVHRVLSALMLIGAAGLCAVLPSVGLLLALAVLLVLRTADRAHHSITSKRTRPGARASDVFGVVLGSPFAATRAALGMLLVSPLGMLAGAVALFVAMARSPHGHTTIARAVSLAVIVFVVVMSLGPGSVPARRQLARVWGGLLPRRNQALIAMGVIGLLVFFLASFAVGQAPDLRPFDFPVLIRNLVRLRSGIVRLFG